MKIRPATVWTVVGIQAAAFGFSALYWSSPNMHDGSISAALSLLTILFLTGFLRKRHCYSSPLLKRVRDASVASGLAMFGLFILVKGAFGIAVSDVSRSLIMVAGLGPFLFLSFGRIGPRRPRPRNGGPPVS